MMKNSFDIHERLYYYIIFTIVHKFIKVVLQRHINLKNLTSLMYNKNRQFYNNYYYLICIVKLSQYLSFSFSNNSTVFHNFIAKKKSKKKIQENIIKKNCSYSNHSL